MKVRKKPIIVDAWKLNSELPENLCPKWVQVSWENGNLDYDVFDSYWEINTLEGKMKAHNGDYLIRGIHGEIYPCRGDIFWETYEVPDDWSK